MPSCVTTAGSMSAAIMMERECRPWLIRVGLVSRAMAMRPSGNRESSCISISGAEGIKREPREGEAIFRKLEAVPRDFMWISKPQRD